MKKPIELGNKYRNKIVNQYPALKEADIPTSYTVMPIDYRRDDIDKYHVIFWHRLLRTMYQVPLEIQCEIQDSTNEEKVKTEAVIFRKTNKINNWEVMGADEALVSKIETGEIKPFPINWKYLILLPSGGIIELGTKDKNTIFSYAQVILAQSGEKDHSEAAKKFIDILLEEANRLRDQLFKPIKEFEKQENIRLYLLFNVYLSNYLSAETMLGMAESKEALLRKELLKYDARTSDLYDEDKRKHIDQHILTCGMFYCSAISYFFMALEGFVNLVFHAFLKQRFRDKAFRTDQRLDLEQKLRFMPSLCKGFNEDSGFPSTILSGFMTLKNYRNSLFHSKVEDSLKSLCFVEDGFVYNYDLDQQKNRFLPSYKIKLTVKDVVDVKTMVDKIVNSILGSMNYDTRVVTETYILKDPNIPFKVSEAGELVMG